MQFLGEVARDLISDPVYHLVEGIGREVTCNATSESRERLIASVARIAIAAIVVISAIGLGMAAFYLLVPVSPVLALIGGTAAIAGVVGFATALDVSVGRVAYLALAICGLAMGAGAAPLVVYVISALFIPRAGGSLALMIDDISQMIVEQHFAVSNESFEDC